VPPTATPVPPTPTTGPTVGGTMVIGIGADADTLDFQNSSSAIMDTICSYMGSSLVTIDPTGKYVPYLAESWTISEDGKTWTFKLKHGVKFHDGNPMTAKDWVYTLDRGKDPNLKLIIGTSTFDVIVSYKAVDDYTFEFTLDAPSFPFAYTLSDAGRVTPISKAAVDKYGDQFGWNPVSVGPMMFKSKVTGDSYTLVRNPDFNWGPAFAHPGPWYIQSMVFKIIPEIATLEAGLESGDIDLILDLPAKDVARIQATNNFQIFEGYLAGNVPSLYFNMEDPLWQDLRVRQAINMAIDRDSMIKALVQGQGIPMYGPISKTVAGYWPGVEDIGYKFDLAKAKQLMADAGWKPGADGILVKDGKPFKIDFRVSSRDNRPQVAEVVKEQLKALGVDLNIVLTEHTVTSTELKKGNYVLALMGVWYGEADIMYLCFHSSSIPWLNWSRINDPDLDKALTDTRIETNPARRQEAVNLAQKIMVEKAYMVPLYTPKVFIPLASKWQGAIFSPAAGNALYLDGAHLAK
jgi:peptide/nickel transport system substrate-binding protein